MNKLLLLAALLCGTSASAGVDEHVYERAVQLVGGLYLHPEQVDAAKLLRAAADGLAQELPWLLVEGEGNTVHLMHGDGRAIGWVSVASLETLPGGLALLEELVLGAGEPLDDVDVRLALVTGMPYALDAYSRVLAGERLERFDERLHGRLVGVGANLSLRDARLVVVDLTVGGPAASAGLQVGDVIERIDERDTLNMPVREAVRRIRGEAQTEVVLKVQRGAAPMSFRIMRQPIVVENVAYRVLDGQVGYVSISNFNQVTLENLRQALGKLGAEDALSHGLVLDLRGNTGGSMKESARVADEFIKAGMLLRTVGPAGGRVQNLQEQMDAGEPGLAEDMPLIVVSDGRTASGAEILAGSLLELGRAGMVGQRTFGKGAVQKVYPLDTDVRLKLTVAQYLLANDRAVAEVGMVPDVVVAPIVLDGDGVRYDGWDTERQRTAWEGFLPEVIERASWRGLAGAPVDLPVELARRAVLLAKGPTREAAQAALLTVSAELRAEQEEHLREALAAQGIAWAPPERPPMRPLLASVQVEALPDAERPDAMVVEVMLHNRGEEALSQALVELNCDSLNVWDGVVVPIGRIEPEASGMGRAIIQLRPGIRPREDAVQITVRAAGRPAWHAGEHIVRTASAALPELSVSASLQGPAGGAQRVVLTLRNLSAEPLTGVEASFDFPSEVDVTLLDQHARLPSLAPGARGELALGVQLGKDVPAEIPLELVVEAERFGELLDWPLNVPQDGRVVTLTAPRISASVHPLHAPVGPAPLHLLVEDDGPLDHVLLWREGVKLGWYANGKAKLDIEPKVSLVEGLNRFVVVAYDEDGLETRAQYVIRGEPLPASTDAVPEESER